MEPLIPEARIVAEQGAELSACGFYRYRLWRYWDTEKGGTAAFVMLNPSTADAERDDPTIRRCIGFAKLWGCGGIEVVNLFALRSTDPTALICSGSPVSSPLKPLRNFDAVYAACQGAKIIVAAWGSQAVQMSVNDKMIQHLRHSFPKKCFSLKMNADGSPRHPLYVPYSTKLRPL